MGTVILLKSFLALFKLFKANRSLIGSISNKLFCIKVGELSIELVTNNLKVISVGFKSLGEE